MTQTNEPREVDKIFDDLERDLNATTMALVKGLKRKWFRVGLVACLLSYSIGFIIRGVL